MRERDEMSAPACASSQPQQLMKATATLQHEETVFMDAVSPSTIGSGADRQTTDHCSERQPKPVLTERLKDAAACLISVLYVGFVGVVLRDFLLFFLFFVPGSSSMTPPSPVALRHVDPNVNSVMTWGRQAQQILTSTA